MDPGAEEARALLDELSEESRRLERLEQRERSQDRTCAAAPTAHVETPVADARVEPVEAPPIPLPSSAELEPRMPKRLWLLAAALLVALMAAVMIVVLARSTP
jgi:hypothetical protein